MNKIVDDGLLCVEFQTAVMRLNRVGEQDFPADGILHGYFNYIIKVEVPVDGRRQDGNEVGGPCDLQQKIPGTGHQRNRRGNLQGIKLSFQQVMDHEGLIEDGEIGFFQIIPGDVLQFAQRITR